MIYVDVRPQSLEGSDPIDSGTRMGAFSPRPNPAVVLQPQVAIQPQAAQQRSASPSLVAQTVLLNATTSTTTSARDSSRASQRDVTISRGHSITIPLEKELHDQLTGTTTQNTPVIQHRTLGPPALERDDDEQAPSIPVLDPSELHDMTMTIYDAKTAEILYDPLSMRYTPNNAPQPASLPQHNAQPKEPTPPHDQPKEPTPPHDQPEALEQRPHRNVTPQFVQKESDQIAQPKIFGQSSDQCKSCSCVML